MSEVNLTNLLETDSSFIDYIRFEDDNNKRSSALSAFAIGVEYVPTYDYPKLNELYDVGDDDESFSIKKTNTYGAVLELEARKNNGVISPYLYELYAGYHEVRLKKMMLVEAAKRLREAGSSTENSLARQEFMYLNTELYGEMNQAAFDGIMATEQKLAESFKPADERSRRIQQELLLYYDRHSFQGAESCSMTREELETCRVVINKRYGEILSAVPDTGDDTYYNASACASIINDCLKSSGLADAGWVCEVNPKKANPATNADDKKIYLPQTTRRTAAELQRLYLHEGEVHARRAFMGEKTGIKPLAKGTANYADVEEGLGVVLESILSGDLSASPAYHRARDRYIMAGIALGADGTPKDGRASFELMWRMIAIRHAKNGVIDDTTIALAKEQATVHDDNAFRGTNFVMPGIIYTKLKVYYEGMLKNIQYLKAHISDLDTALDHAMMGKHDHTDPVEHGCVVALVNQANNN